MDQCTTGECICFGYTTGCLHTRGAGLLIRPKSLATSLIADDASDKESDEGSEEPEADEEEEQPTHDISVKTTGYDARFPSYNQARNCYTRYNEYHRCIGVDEKREDDPECKSYQRAYRSICPMEWVNSWNEQRDSGTWPGKY